MKYQLIEITSNTYQLYPNSSIIIIKKAKENYEINLMDRMSSLTDDVIQDGSNIKIYNKTGVNIKINDIILKNCKFFEFLYISSDWICLNGDIYEDIEDNTVNQTEQNIDDEEEIDDSSSEEDEEKEYSTIQFTTESKIKLNDETDSTTCSDSTTELSEMHVFIKDSARLKC